MAKKTAAKKETIPYSFYTDAADRKKRDHYARMTDAQKEEFKKRYYMLMRSMSSAQGSEKEYFLPAVNRAVNENYKSVPVREHPELCWLSLTAVGLGSKTNHPFIRAPKGKAKRDKLREFLIEVYPLLKDDELELLIQINTLDDFKDLAEQYGYTTAQIRDIFG